jgi:hypothetical protein
VLIEPALAPRKKKTANVEETDCVEKNERVEEALTGEATETVEKSQMVKEEEEEAEEEVSLTDLPSWLPPCRHPRGSEQQMSKAPERP